MARGRVGDRESRQKARAPAHAARSMAREKAAVRAEAPAWARALATVQVRARVPERVKGRVGVRASAAWALTRARALGLVRVPTQASVEEQVSALGLGPGAAGGGQAPVPGMASVRALQGAGSR